MQSKEQSSEDARANKQFIYLMFPVIILAIISFINPKDLSQIVIMAAVKLLIVLWQGFSLSNFIKSNY